MWKERLNRSRVWSVALYSTVGKFDFDTGLGTPLFHLSSRRLRTSKAHVHTRADPFLYSHGGCLYMFCEVKQVGGRGYIDAYVTRDMKSLEHIGTVLQEPHHLS